MDRKDIFMSGFKSKIGYSFTYKDLTEFEAIIDFYEQQFKKQQKIIDKSILKEIALKEEIKEILEELENMYEISELEEQVNNINKIRDYIINLQQENKILKENAENNDKVVDKVNWENQLLKKENEQLKERIEYLERSNNRREGTITEQYHEIVELETRWNKLKEYIKETKLKEFEKSYGKRYGKTFTQAEIVVCNMILDKTQELQGSDE